MTRNNNRPLVPQARQALDVLKEQTIAKYQLHVPSKYEVAEEKGIPLKKGYNGSIQAKDAGAIGGQLGGKVGGNMVKELIKLAKEKM